MTATTASITLQRGSSADLVEVDRLMQRAFDPRFGEAWSRAQCLGILSMPGVWLTLARLGNRMAGFALARAVAGEAELLLLATDPVVRRRGVGGALLRSVVDEARSRGVAQLYLEVRSSNPAVDLYRSIGFIKVGERIGYYRGTNSQLFDAWTFRLQIA